MSADMTIERAALLAFSAEGNRQETNGLNALAQEGIGVVRTLVNPIGRSLYEIANIAISNTLDADEPIGGILTYYMNRMDRETLNDSTAGKAAIGLGDYVGIVSPFASIPGAVMQPFDSENRAEIFREMVRELAEAGVPGARYGVIRVDDEYKEVYVMAYPDGRSIESDVIGNYEGAVPDGVPVYDDTGDARDEWKDAARGEVDAWVANMRIGIEDEVLALFEEAGLDMNDPTNQARFEDIVGNAVTLYYDGTARVELDRLVEQRQEMENDPIGALIAENVPPDEPAIEGETAIKNPGMNTPAGP